MKRTLGSAAAVVSFFAVASGAQAQVSCSDEIGPTSRRIVMTDDLFCSGSSIDESITLVGPVTLEMRGKTITCTGQNNDGVLLTGMRARLIGPGTIVDCNNGVFLSGDGSHTVQKVTIGPSESRISDGIVMFSPKNRIRGNVIKEVSFNGISIFNDSDSNNINSNRISDIGGIGIRIIESGGDFATGNNISKNRIIDVDETGIEVGQSGRLVSNTIVDPGSNGITVMPGNRANVTSGVRILANRVQNAGNIGIHVLRNTIKSVIRRNRVTKTRRDGLFVGRGALSNTITKNTVRDSGGFDLRDRNRDCGNNTWSANVADTENPRGCIR